MLTNRSEVLDIHFEAEVVYMLYELCLRFFFFPVYRRALIVETVLGGQSHWTLVNFFLFLLIWLKTPFFRCFYCSDVANLILSGQKHFCTISAKLRAIFRSWSVRVVIDVPQMTAYLTKNIFLVSQVL